MLTGQSGCIDAPSVDKLGDIPNQLILALWNSLAKLPCIHVGWQLGIWSQAFSSVTQFCFTAHQCKTQDDQEGPVSFRPSTINYLFCLSSLTKWAGGRSTLYFFILLCLNTLREGVVIFYFILFCSWDTGHEAMKCHRLLVLHSHYQVWDKKTYKGPLFTSLLVMNHEKYVVSARARGGRQDFYFTFLCHFARPVSLILNFIAQKVRGGRICRIENLLWLALYLIQLKIRKNEVNCELNPKLHLSCLGWM